MQKKIIQIWLKFVAAGWCATTLRLFLPILTCLIFVTGCKTPMEHRQLADERAYEIIRESQQKALGKTEDLNIIQPSEIFRRKLVESQGLKYSMPESLGRDKLNVDKLWPDDEYIDHPQYHDDMVLAELKEPAKLSLIDALMIGAENNFDYQSQKESIFSAALDLDLERNDFKTIFGQAVESRITENTTGDSKVRSMTQSADSSFSKKLKNGTEITASIAFDLANLLTQGGASAIGMKGDASVSIPLMRGSGKHIVTESLTQAERNIIYAIYNFERYKKQFAVNVTSRYLGVLERYEQIKNAEENYKGLVISVRRTRRMADAGEQTEIEVFQAYQNQLSARDRWISTIQSYKQALDEFKIFIGLPTDAEIELDRNELSNLYSLTDEWLDSEDEQKIESHAPADAPIDLPDITKTKGGPFEIDAELATNMAFENRLDLRVTQGKLEDDKRWVVYQADRLRAEVTLLGSASSGARRSGSGADTNDRLIETHKALLSALLTVDLPFERTMERNNYRKSLIALESSMRDLRSLEDQIKLEIRNRLRELVSARESVRIQAKAVEIAQKRVDSTNKFYEKGRAEIRDVLEAQESLLSAHNSLTTAIKNYRIAELQLQRDMGVLEVNEKGLIKEIDPEVLKDAG